MFVCLFFFKKKLYIYLYLYVKLDFIMYLYVYIYMNEYIKTCYFIQSWKKKIYIYIEI